VVTPVACGATTEREETAFADTENGKGKETKGLLCRLHCHLHFVTVRHMRTI